MPCRASLAYLSPAVEVKKYLRRIDEWLRRNSSRIFYWLLAFQRGIWRSVQRMVVRAAGMREREGGRLPVHGKHPVTSAKNSFLLIYTLACSSTSLLLCHGGRS